jgi:regulator of sirC expression with transglutaminase-like and TPR domain
MPRAEAERRIIERFQQPPTGEQRKKVIAEFLEPAKRKAILVRMLGNLSGSAQQRSDEAAIRRYADVILTIDPTNFTQRGMRIQLSLRSGRYQQALTDIDWLLEHQTDVIDVTRLRELRQQVEQAKASQR